MWNLGAVQVKSTPAIPIADSNYEFTVESQPEIQHVFRPEIKSPPVWISTAFAIIVLSPWLQLLKSVRLIIKYVLQ